MFKHNALTYSFKIILQIIEETLFFPIWWYSVGLLDFIKRVFVFIANQEKSLGFSIWLKNIFVPMYGQYNFAGRIISFFVRLVQVIFRGIALLIFLILGLISILIWLLFPILLILAILFQLI